jgi:predicted O-methyltransferase YrrM
MILNTLKRIANYLSYSIRRPHRNGHGIHSPFLFDFISQVLRKNLSKNQAVRAIESIRKKLLNDHTTIEIEDFGAGSSRKLGNTRKISQITRISSTPPKYGRLLYSIVSYYKPDSIIELGCCLGIGTMYLSSANKNAKVFTIEGSETLMQKAIQNFDRIQLANVYPRLGIFDEALPALLKENSKFDLVFVDGNHRKDAMLKYFNLLLPYAHQDSIIIFDDIRWSDEMEQGWHEISSNEKVTLSLDLHHLGIVFFNEKLIKQHFELYF